MILTRHINILLLKYYRHILPSNLFVKQGANESNYEQLLSHGEPIIIYMHGNSGARPNNQRIELYRKLRDINCHVIAVDYTSIVQLFKITFTQFRRCICRFSFNETLFPRFRLCRFYRRRNRRDRLSIGCDGDI